MPLPKLSRSQLATGLAIAVAIAIVGGLVWAFAQQLALARQMRLEEQRMERLVAAEQERHDRLASQREHVRSDEYVEEWARVEAKMARPGEVPVVVLEGPEESTAQPSQSTPTPTPQAQPFWAELWEAIFPGSPR